MIFTECRILKNGKCKITQYYSTTHPSIDLVGGNSTLDYIVSHSDGMVIEIVDNRSNIKGSTGNLAYGNYMKIKHNDEYETLYAHLKTGLNLKKNQQIKKGEIIGYMWDSGNAYGKHLHFEVWKNNKRINPLEYINKEFSINEEKQQNNYKIGDIVEINGVYISSTSKEKLRPLITKGKITKIVKDAENQYLLEDGEIGWVNDSVIVSKNNQNDIKYLSNKKYKGNSIVDALNQIDIDSSYNYRSKLAQINNINNYRGTNEQNTRMLNLLKKGLLKY